MGRVTGAMAVAVAIVLSAGVSACGADDDGGSAATIGEASSEAAAGEDAGGSLLQKYEDEGVEGLLPCASDISLEGGHDETWDSEGVVGTDGVPFPDYEAIYVSRSPQGIEVEFSAIDHGNGALAYAIGVRHAAEGASWASALLDAGMFPAGVTDGDGVSLSDVPLESNDGGETINATLAFSC